MSADEYPCIFSREMETIVYILTNFSHVRTGAPMIMNSIDVQRENHCVTSQLLKTAVTLGHMM